MAAGLHNRCRRMLYALRVRYVNYFRTAASGGMGQAGSGLRINPQKGARRQSVDPPP